MRKLKVIHIIGALVVGGAQQLLRTVFEYIDKSKFDIKLCCLKSKYTNPIGEEIKNLGVEIVDLQRSTRPYDFKTIVNLIKYLRLEKPDIVHTHLFQANFHGRIAAKVARIPVVISHEHNIYSWKTWRHILLDRILAEFTDRILTCSEAVKRFTACQEYIPISKFEVFHNAIDPSEFTSFVDRSRIKKKNLEIQDRPVIGTVGVLNRQKGHCYLIDAMSEVLNSFPSTRLLIVGDGSLKKELQQKVKNLGLSQSALFTGMRRDISQLLAVMDIFVQPSLWEGFGITILEAMCMGLPVVASNVDGIPEVVLDGKTGILVPPGKSHLLANAIIKLLRDKDLTKKMGEAGRQRVLSRFTAQSYAKKLENLYKSLLRQE